MSLTQEGEWLYQQATEIINKVEGVENYLSNSQEEPQGIIRVDAATPFTLHAIAPVVSGFNQRFEKIKLLLSSNESIVDLIARNVDTAIRIGNLNDSTLKARKLGNSYRKVYASPEYLKKHGQLSKVSDLVKNRCLGFANTDKLNTWPLLTEEAEWIKINPEILADNGEILKQLAIQGCGQVCISSFIAEQDVRDGKLVCVLEQETELVPVPVYAVFYSDNGMNLRLRSFIDYLVEHMYLGS